MSDATDYVIGRASTDARARVRFCTRCGTVSSPPPNRVASLPARRVCGECGLGILLSCPASALEQSGLEFVIAGAGLRLTAISEAAESLLDSEFDLLGRPLDAVLVGLPPRTLALAGERALTRWCEPVDLPAAFADGVRGAAGRELRVRVSPCGTPRGVLLAFAAPGRSAEPLPPLRSVGR